MSQGGVMKKSYEEGFWETLSAEIEAAKGKANLKFEEMQSSRNWVSTPSGGTKSKKKPRNKNSVVDVTPAPPKWKSRPEHHLNDEELKKWLAEPHDWSST